VDPFAVGVLLVVALVVLAAVLAARANAGKPTREFGRTDDRGHRRPAASTALEHQDLQEMLAATNAHRRARGLPERSLTDAIREFEG
jgi:hypothetical protein